MQDSCFPLPEKEGEELPQLPSPVPIETYYPYSEERVERILEGVKIKKFSPNPAGLTEEKLIDIRYFIVWTGMRIHGEICTLNSQIEWLSARDLRYPTAAERQFVRQMFPAVELSETGRAATLLFLSRVKYELLPVPLRSALNEIAEMLEDGYRKLCEARVYKAMLEDLYRRDDECRQKAREDEDLRRAKRRSSLIQSKQMAMEIRHVQAQSGFIYVLDSEDVPGLFKVGFTQRNPDNRAKEVSHKRHPGAVFRVRRYWRTDDPYIVEQRIFSRLSRFKDKGGEFYCCDLSLIVSIIEECINSIGVEDLLDPLATADADFDLPLSWGP